SAAELWKEIGGRGDDAPVGRRVAGLPVARLRVDRVLGVDLEAPPELSADRIDRVEVAVPRANVDAAAHLDGVRGHRVAGGEEPRGCQRTDGGLVQCRAGGEG